MKQQALALELGISQQTVSNLENSQIIEDEVLEKIAKALGVTAEGIKQFNEETIINIISSTLHDNAGSINNQCTLHFNPIDKWLEVIEENKKLYERLLQSEREKVELLKQQKA